MRAAATYLSYLATDLPPVGNQTMSYSPAAPRAGLTDVAGRCDQLIARFDNLPGEVMFALCAAYMAAVATVDHLLGDEIPLIFMYLPVVAIACWKVGLYFAVHASLFCSLLWLVDDLWLEWRRGGPTAFEWCTAATHFLCFLFVAIVTARLHLAFYREAVIAKTDALTSLPNKLAFDERVTLELPRIAAEGSPATAVFADCDNFKQVNDTLGHAVGDELLREAAAAIRRGIREGDLVARFGGDEFVLWLPGADEPQAREIVARVQDQFAAIARTRNWPVSLSIGAATFTSAPATVDAALRAADELMYRVKRGQKGSAEYVTVA